MKVEKSVGWLKGQNGTGNVFELSSNGGFALAMIWADGKFHYLPITDLKGQSVLGTAAISGERATYLKESDLPKNSDGSLLVENPTSWDRLYTSGTVVVIPDTDTSTETEDSEEIEFPFSVEIAGIKLPGKLKINVGGITKFLSLLS